MKLVGVKKWRQEGRPGERPSVDGSCFRVDARRVGMLSREPLEAGHGENPESLMMTGILHLGDDVVNHISMNIR